ncbi:MAG: hypothetical protein GXP08_15515 [Gammaproteobacteria bacterium]|nr:hypothetical protein [Gammaproteobacteria bacterium]
MPKSPMRSTMLPMLVTDRDLALLFDIQDVTINRELRELLARLGERPSRISHQDLLPAIKRHIDAESLTIADYHTFQPRVTDPYRTLELLHARDPHVRDIGWNRNPSLYATTMAFEKQEADASGRGKDVVAEKAEQETFAAAETSNTSMGAEQVGIATLTGKRQQNYQERKQMAANAGNTPAQQAAAARLLDNNDNILRAESAAYVYKVDEFNRGHINELPEAPTGLNLIDPKEIPGLENATFTSKKSGFGAALFESEINGETMLAYRGTNPGVTGMKDAKTNLLQGIGGESDQYDQAMDLAELANKTLEGNFVNVGHSLGAGLASAATAVTGIKGYTFNAAGLHPDTATRKGGMNNDAAAKLIQTRAIEGEVLTTVQRHGNNVLSGLGAGGGAAMAGLVGAGLGYLASKALPDIPEAVGEMKTLPSVKGGSPMARHGMDQVIDGIEVQKKEDIKTLTQSAG